MPKKHNRAEVSTQRDPLYFGAMHLDTHAMKLHELVAELPPDSWVALTPDKHVVGTGRTREEAARDAADNCGHENPRLIKVPRIVTRWPEHRHD